MHTETLGAVVDSDSSYGRAGQAQDPGSRRTDHVTERSEYADARIASYRIIDPETPISLLPLRLADELGHVEGEK